MTDARADRRRLRRHTWVLLAVVAVLTAAPARRPQAAQADAGTRFAVIGDMGTGGRQQYQVARQLLAVHRGSPLEFVLTVGDNIYESRGTPDLTQAYRLKFERPFAGLLARGVRFYATLGNHDSPNERFYKPFNMNGDRYYSFTRRNVQFVALDSTMMDARQLAWLTATLRASTAPWKIAFFHHPIYSSGRFHGGDTRLRASLEPIFVEHRVQVAFSGHDHLYERMRAQKGIVYFVCGAGGRLREGDLAPSPLTARGFDADNSFMVIEISGADLRFRALSRTGSVVDSGVVHADPAHADVNPA